MFEIFFFLFGGQYEICKTKNYFTLEFRGKRLWSYGGMSVIKVNIAAIAYIIPTFDEYWPLNPCVENADLNLKKYNIPQEFVSERPFFNTNIYKFNFMLC